MFPTASKSHRPAPDRHPLDRAALDRLALSYVGRYATTCARLRLYLKRKLDRHGWAEEEAPPLDAVVGRMAELGYVDDKVFARARAEGLTRRGYGPRRVGAALADAGVETDDADAAIIAVDADAFATAFAFARRRRLGPFAPVPTDPTEDREGRQQRRRKAIAAMMRAGHDYRVAQAVLDATVDGNGDPIA